MREPVPNLWQQVLKRALSLVSSQLRGHSHDVRSVRVPPRATFIVHLSRGDLRALYANHKLPAAQ